MDSFKRIMRYNDYQHDPYSEGSPTNAICARGDLRASHPSAGGCLDCKVSDVFMAKDLKSEVVNGPSSTASSYGPGQKPFRWSENPSLDNTCVSFRRQWWCQLICFLLILALPQLFRIRRFTELPCEVLTAACSSFSSLIGHTSVSQTFLILCLSGSSRDGLSPKHTWLINQSSTWTGHVRDETLLLRI